MDFIVVVRSLIAFVRLGIKRVVLLIVLLVLTTIGGAAVYLMNLDVNEYRDEVSAWVQRHTGRTLDFGGPLQLKLALIPTLVAHRVSFSNAPWGSRTDLARIDRLEARIALLPLLGGELKFSRIAVEGADIMLEVNEQGVGNWEIALAHTESAPPTDTDAEGHGWMPRLQRVVVQSSTITHRTHRQSRPHVIEVKRLRLEAMEDREKLRVSAELAINASAMQLDGKIDRLTRWLRGEPYTFHLAARALGLETDLNGSLSASKDVRTLEFDAAVSAPRADELPPRWRRHIPADSTLETHAIVAGTPPTVTLTRLDATLGKERIKGELRILRDDETLSVEGALHAGHIDLDRWLNPHPRKSRNGARSNRAAKARTDGNRPRRAASGLKVALDLQIDELTSAKARAEDVDVRFGFDGRALRFSSLAGELDFGLGRSRVRGDLEVHLGNRRPRVEGTLHADRLDLGPWLAARAGPPESEGLPDDMRAKPTRIFSDEPLDLGALGVIDAALELSVDELWGRWMRVKRVGLNLSLDDAVLRISPLTAEVTGGISEAAIRVEARRERPRWQLSAKAAQLDVGRLIDETHLDGLIEGRANVSIELEGEGRSVAEVAGSLDGHARILMGNGRLIGEAAEQMAVLDTAVGGLTKVLGTLIAEEAASTRLNCVAGDLEFTNGIAVSQLLLADTEYSTVRGEGRIDLGEETLDLKFHPRSKSITLNVAVPVQVMGTLAEPTFSLDSMAIVARVGGLVGIIVFPPAAVASLGALGVYGAGKVVGGLDLGGSENDCLRIAAPESHARSIRGKASTDGPKRNTTPRRHETEH